MKFRRRVLKDQDGNNTGSYGEFKRRNYLEIVYVGYRRLGNGGLCCENSINCLSKNNHR